MQQEVKNKKRRTVIVFGLTAAVAFILGKIFSDNTSLMLPFMKGPVRETRFSNFIITEDKDEMTLSNNNGDPIFIVDKKSFTN